MAMMLVIGCAVLVLSQWGYAETNCDSDIGNNYPYEEEILLQNIPCLGQFAIDYATETLFFSYLDSEKDHVHSAFLNLKTNKFKVMSVDGLGFGRAVDNDKHIVYLGSFDGIYKFDYDTETATHIEGSNHNIQNMFFKKHIIYTTFTNKNVYMFKDGQSTIIPELTGSNAAGVVQNNNLDYYFYNDTGLYKLKRVNGEIISLGDYIVSSMTADDDGNLYVAALGETYSINEKDEIVQIPSQLNTILGVAIESNGNIIYSTLRELMRLKRARHPCSPQ